jgi:hypothetical protein
MLRSQFLLLLIDLGYPHIDPDLALTEYIFVWNDSPLETLGERLDRSLYFLLKYTNINNRSDRSLRSTHHNLGRGNS